MAQLDGDTDAKPQWRVRSLLRPDLGPGLSVQIDSLDLKGSFLIDSAHHVGDTFGNEWTTELELLSI